MCRAGFAVPRALPDDAFSASRCWTCCCTRFSFACRSALSSRSFGTAYVLTAVCGCKAEKNRPSLVLIPKLTCSPIRQWQWIRIKSFFFYKRNQTFQENCIRTIKKWFKDKQSTPIFFLKKVKQLILGNSDLPLDWFHSVVTVFLLLRLPDWLDRSIEHAWNPTPSYFSPSHTRTQSFSRKQHTSISQHSETDFLNTSVQYRKSGNPVLCDPQQQAPGTENYVEAGGVKWTGGHGIKEMDGF